MGSRETPINTLTDENWSKIKSHCEDQYELIVFKISCCFHHNDLTDEVNIRIRRMQITQSCKIKSC